MSRARSLSRLANESALSVSTDLNVGINSTSPVEKLNVVGVVSATSFSGDGSGLTGVASTDNIITGTAATFTGSVNVSGAANFSGITTVGILTAYTSVKVGAAVTINSSGANVVGVVTATNVSVGQSVTAASFHGDGSKLQGVSAPSSFDITSSLFI
tara:strand:+ start:104 stop:574 length:471 start_codon:yes stop_codon:yes gene_type:complete